MRPVLLKNTTPLVTFFYPIGGVEGKLFEKLNDILRLPMRI